METKEIIKYLGGPAAVARRFKIKSQAVSLWIYHDRIPMQRCPHIERWAQDMGLREVRCETLRPDIDWAQLRGTA